MTTGPRPRPGLSLIGYTTSLFTPGGDAPIAVPIDPFPLRLHPGEQTELTVWYRVTDCDAIHDIDPDDDDIDIQVRIADGPVSWITAERTIDARDLAVGASAAPSWPAAIAQHACQN